MKFYKTYYCCCPDYRAEWGDYYAELGQDCGAFGQKWYEIKTPEKSGLFYNRRFWDQAQTNSEDLLNDLPKEFALKIFGACAVCGQPSKSKVCSSCFKKLPNTSWEKFETPGKITGEFLFAILSNGEVVCDPLREEISPI